MGLAERFAEDRDSAYLAMKNGDHAEALRLGEAIEFYLATTPNQERDSYVQNWRNEIAAFNAKLRRLINAAGGIQTNKIEYRQPRNLGYREFGHR